MNYTKQNKNLSTKDKYDISKKYQFKDLLRIARKGTGKHFILIVLFTLISAAFGIVTPLLTKYVIEYLGIDGNLNTLIFLLCGMFGLLLLRTSAAFILPYYGSTMQNYAEYNLRKYSFQHYGKLKIEYIDKKNEGHFMVRIGDDSYNASLLVRHVPENMLSAFILSIGTFTNIFIYDWLLGIILLGITVIIVVMPWFVKSIFISSYAKITANEEKVKSNLVNSISGLKESKIYLAENKEIQKFGDSLNLLKKSLKSNYLLGAGFGSFDIMMNGLIGVAIFSIGAWRVTEGSMSIAQLVSAWMFGTQLVEPIRKFFAVFDLLMSSMTSARRIIDFWNVPVEDYIHGKLIAQPIKGEIEFKNVSFEYIVDGSEKLSPDEEWFKYVNKKKKNAKEEEAAPSVSISALKNVSLKIEAGQKVAFVGETGSGKSTLLKTLLRFYDPTEGQVFIDGLDINEHRVDQVREYISYLQQDPYLFYDSIKNNLLFALPTKHNLSEEEVNKKLEHALITSKAKTFVGELNKKENEIIGPRGINLSGGQKQRIAIARAIIKDAPILLFDEATSALDNETEKEIQNSFAEITEGKTVIYIAHRLTTIQKLDKIFVFKKGELIEEGSHNELLAKKGYYFNLVNVSAKKTGGEANE